MQTASIGARPRGSNSLTLRRWQAPRCRECLPLLATVNQPCEQAAVLMPADLHGQLIKGCNSAPDTLGRAGQRPEASICAKVGRTPLRGSTEALCSYGIAVTGQRHLTPPLPRMRSMSMLTNLVSGAVTSGMRTTLRGPPAPRQPGNGSHPGPWWRYPPPDERLGHQQRLLLITF